MPEFTSYCQNITNLPDDNLDKIYHDTEYGFSIHDDNELFGRLILEINQAGLSWYTILTKKDNFREAYDNFDIPIIAKYQQIDIDRLLSNPGIIRNKLKVNAAIYNAKRVLEIQKEYGSFKKWLDQNSVKTKQEWIKLFKKNFKFTGGEITNEFLLSTGYLSGSHIPTCPIYNKIKH